MSMRTTTTTTAAHGLAAQRREGRSSTRFHLGIASCLLLLCVLVSCLTSGLFAPRHGREMTLPRPSTAGTGAASSQDTHLLMPPEQKQRQTHQHQHQHGRDQMQEHDQHALSPDTSSSSSSSSPPTLDTDTQQQQQQHHHHHHHDATVPLRLLTFNIRLAADRSQREPGEHPWHTVRGPRVCAQLRFLSAGHDSPFLCLQETLHAQLRDIQAHLGPRWAHIGRGRDLAETDGEFSPVFYRADTWACERSETRWLSETPGRPSRGWDAALNRIVTMGLFAHRATGLRVVVMSTHFDHEGVVARRNSAGLLLRFAREWGTLGGRDHAAAVLIGGDLNSEPDDEAYRVMTAPGSGVSDLAGMVPEGGRCGNHWTYTGFGGGGGGGGGGDGPAECVSQTIDFLFIQGPTTASVETFGVLANRFDDDGVFFSDHRPVVSDLQIRVPA